ncbi:hypothetical protein [Vibrio algarum]|uniref:Antibiotic biosynthesis monooxygenase n=1 Tax=Vibrio algarum TaxID=3020714 RepID=A0ABT4YT15_9VIBR|nr:hypothetical protein [Vibrio sp. KJ40-1]MDB1124704.1 hypothetical protein [Vibrio sp. KJ40-1]
MKTLTTSTIAAVLASSISSASTFEIVNTQFVEGVSYQEQQEAMESLNSVVKHFDGFQSRSYFYSEELNRWTDIIVWENADLAQSATVKAMENPEALEVFSKMDSENTIFSHYQSIGYIEAELTSQ